MYAFFFIRAASYPVTKSLLYVMKKYSRVQTRRIGETTASRRRICFIYSGFPSDVKELP